MERDIETPASDNVHHDPDPDSPDVLLHDAAPSSSNVATENGTHSPLDVRLAADETVSNKIATFTTSPPETASDLLCGEETIEGFQVQLPSTFQQPDILSSSRTPSSEPPVGSESGSNLRIEGVEGDVDMVTSTSELERLAAEPLLDPCLIPLPNSDAEEEDSTPPPSPGYSSRASSSTLYRRNMSHLNRTLVGGASRLGHFGDRSVSEPTEADDNQALWRIGDSALERRDRRVHERWKAGLGMIFVLANVLSVIILCVALELYRRTKAAHPGLISKIRARHIARMGKRSPFSPILSLLFEADAPFVVANTVFLVGLCTSLACTVMSDLAMRWVARYESRLPPANASARDRMIARMEWNERMERLAVPWLLEIGIPGLLYSALFMFFAGAVMRAFPKAHPVSCGAAGVVMMVVSIRAMWSYEPALDARLRPRSVRPAWR
ncbi:hypothetical protein BC834DRAFT_971216 [Gloeopeniophorella convolvens]|nr:hypothetical protein BC834DRAFT_971216 [Gloeopeniophorella convolvens]